MLGAAHNYDTTKRADKVAYAKIMVVQKRRRAGNISKVISANFPRNWWIDLKVQGRHLRGTGYNGIYSAGEGDYNRQASRDRRWQRGIGRA